MTPPRSPDEIREQLADLAKVKAEAQAHGARDFASAASLDSILGHEGELLEELRLAEAAACRLPKSQEGEVPREPSPGYYSLIQFCPCSSRMETVNVGIVVFCPARAYLGVRLAGNNDRVARVFTNGEFKPWSIVPAIRGVANRLLAPQYRPRTVDELEQYIGSRGNDIILTPLRSLVILEPEQQLQQLFWELVEYPPVKATWTAKAPGDEA